MNVTKQIIREISMITDTRFNYIYSYLIGSLRTIKFSQKLSSYYISVYTVS